MSEAHHQHVVQAAPVQTPPQVVERPVVVRQGGGLTQYAAIKYAFILAIVIVVLYFTARYVIPLLSD